MNAAAWYDWSVERLEAGSYLDKVMLSFWNEAQYHEFNKQYRGRYTILHTLNDPTSDRFYVWVEKNTGLTPVRVDGREIT